MKTRHLFWRLCLCLCANTLFAHNYQKTTSGLLSSLGKDIRTSTIDERYELLNIKQNKVHYVATEVVVPFTQEGKTV